MNSLTNKTILLKNRKQELYWNGDKHITLHNKKINIMDSNLHNLRNKYCVLIKTFYFNGLGNKSQAFYSKKVRQISFCPTLLSA